MNFEWILKVLLSRLASGLAVGYLREKKVSRVRRPEGVEVCGCGCVVLLVALEGELVVFLAENMLRSVPPAACILPSPTLFCHTEVCGRHVFLSMDLT